jgi:hypothetical protein
VELMVTVVGLGTVNVRKRTSNEKRSKITPQHSSSLDNEGNCKGMLLDMKQKSTLVTNDRIFYASVLVAVRISGISKKMQRSLELFVIDSGILDNPNPT